MFAAVVYVQIVSKTEQHVARHSINHHQFRFAFLTSGRVWVEGDAVNEQRATV